MAHGRRGARFLEHALARSRSKEGGTLEAADPLDRACDRIWFEIRALLPRHRWLSERGPLLSFDQARELTRVSVALDRLRRRSTRYRDVLRAEAWAKALDGDEDPPGARAALPGHALEATGGSRMTAAEILGRAIAEWERGEYYEAHETLEDFGEAVEEDDVDFAIALALVQIAAGLHKLKNDVGSSAVPGKLERALAVLRGAPEVWRTLDIGALVADLEDLCRRLAAGERPKTLPPLRCVGFPT